MRLRRRGALERLAGALRPYLRASRLLVGRTGLALEGVTVLVWILEGVIFLLVARSIDVQIDLLEGTFIVVLASFFALLPAAPGYVGTFDSAIVFGLGALDVSGGAPVAFALLVRFILFVPITILGLGLMIVRYGGLARLRGRHPVAETTATRSAGQPHKDRLTA